MGKFISVFLAAFQYAIGIYIFKKPDLTRCGPLLSSLVVLLALSLVLWTLPLYPKKLRKLTSTGNILAQYLAAVFQIEYIMGCFWFPLEKAILAFLPKVASFLEESFLQHLDVPCNLVCEVFRSEGAGMFLSYITSLIILATALHATRIINLNLLFSYGPAAFASDLHRKVQNVHRVCNIDFLMPKKQSKKSKKSDYCASDDDFEFEPGLEPSTTDSEFPYREY